MDRIAGLQFFVRVVESGSFSKAARELGVGQPAVSKHIAALERRLGAQLLNRTSRGLRPTLAGTDFYESAFRVLRELDDAESRVANGHGQPSGNVRVAVPPIMTGMMIVPNLPGFFGRFPGLKVEFSVSERYADLVQEGLDLAIRIGNLDSSGLIARKIGGMRLATLASAAYLARHGTPLSPADLDVHHLLANRFVGSISSWHFTSWEPGNFVPRPGRFICNNPADMRAAVLADLGIVQISSGMFEIELRSGRVVEVLKDFARDPLPIHAVYSSSRMPHRVQVVSDLIAQCLDEQPGFRL